MWLKKTQEDGKPGLKFMSDAGGTELLICLAWAARMKFPYTVVPTT